MSINFDDISILSINDVIYGFGIEAVNLLQNVYFLEESAILYIKMNKKIKKFDEVEIEKLKLQKPNFHINDVAINKTSVSIRISLVKKGLKLLLVAKMVKKFIKKDLIVNLFTMKYF